MSGVAGSSCSPEASQSRPLLCSPAWIMYVVGFVIYNLAVYVTLHQASRGRYNAAISVVNSFLAAFNVIL